ncbi:MAG: hypothetical protein Q7T18_11740, partial [Sedimentisphaerales bacterium]|nr:hypothetical protein [Sedimentisphaerales bacterium]
SGQWWWNKHPETGKPLISSVHPACGVPILPDKEWHEKDFQEVNADVDLSRSFIDQMFELRKHIPTAAHGNYQEPENSIAVASFGDVNSYFMVASKGKNCFFSIVVLNGENSSEVYNSESITDSYHVIHCERMFNCQYVRESKDCLNSLFLFDCRNCEFIFGGSNLRNKKYVWFNEQLTQEEWERRRAEVNTASRAAMKPFLEKFELMILDAVWPENFNIKSENCLGEYLTNCEDSKYVYYADGGARNNYWIAWLIGRAEHNAFVADPAHSRDTYCSTALANCHNCKFGVYSARCKDIEYCLECFDCEYCFGCIGLRKKKFCILNKQYSEAEYWQKVDEIKCVMLDRGEYTEGVPSKFSLGWFPESGAAKYYESTPEFGAKIGAHL